MNTLDKTNSGISIDWETADRITVNVLMSIHKDAIHVQENADKFHPDDVGYYSRLIPAVRVVLGYFGERV